MKVVNTFLQYIVYNVYIRRGNVKKKLCTCILPSFLSPPLPTPQYERLCNLLSPTLINAAALRRNMKFKRKIVITPKKQRMRNGEARGDRKNPSLFLFNYLLVSFTAQSANFYRLFLFISSHHRRFFNPFFSFLLCVDQL